MQLLASKVVTLDANGAGTVTVGPPSNRRWLIVRTDIQVVLLAGSIQPRAFLFRNSQTPGNQIDATYQGSRNSSDHSFELRSGETASVRWTGGTSGNSATATFYGSEAPD